MQFFAYLTHCEYPVRLNINACLLVLHCLIFVNRVVKKTCYFVKTCCLLLVSLLVILFPK